VRCGRFVELSPGLAVPPNRCMNPTEPLPGFGWDRYWFCGLVSGDGRWAKEKSNQNCFENGVDDIDRFQKKGEKRYVGNS
jgi:hypothetical protein